MDVGQILVWRVICSGIAFIPFCVAWFAMEAKDLERAMGCGLLAILFLILAEGVPPVVILLTWPREDAEQKAQEKAAEDNGG